jgi:hypothetical protein
VYWCNQKAGCCWSPYCGKECRKTRNKRYARKDAKGRVMIAHRRMELVAKSMGVAFKKVCNGLMQVTGAMGATLSSLFSGDYFNQ